MLAQAQQNSAARTYAYVGCYTTAPRNAPRALRICEK